MARYKNNEVINQIVEKQHENIQEELKKYLLKMFRFYGSMEEFQKAYVNGLIVGENIVPKNLRKAFVCYLDVNQPDLVCREQMEYMYLLEKIYDKSGLLIINSDNIALMWQNAMKKLTLREQDVIIKHFGLYGKTETLSEIASEYNVTKECIRQAEERALEKFREGKCKKIFAPCVENVIDANREAELVKQYFKNNSVFRDDNNQNINNSLAIGRLVKIAIEEQKNRLQDANQIMNLAPIKRVKIIDSAFQTSIDVKKLKYLSKRAKNRYNGNETIYNEEVVKLSQEVPENVLIAVYKQASESEAAKEYRNKLKRVNGIIKNHPDYRIKNNPTLEEVGMDARVSKILESENIKNLAELLTYSMYELKQMKSLSKNSILSIVLTLHKYGFSIEDEEIEQDLWQTNITKKQAKKMRVEEVGFSPRTVLGLRRAGIETLGDITNYSTEDILKIKNIGEKCIEEIIFALNLRGLKLEESNNAKKKKSISLNEKYDFSYFQSPETEQDDNPSEAYTIALQLFDEFCKPETTEINRIRIKNEIQSLFKDLDECEALQIRAKIYKQIENIGKENNNSKKVEPEKKPVPNKRTSKRRKNVKGKEPNERE